MHLPTSQFHHRRNHPNDPCKVHLNACHSLLEQQIIFHHVRATQAATVSLPPAPQFLSNLRSHQTNPPPSRNPPRAIPNHRQRPRSRKTSRSSETKQPFKHVRQTRHNRPPSAPQFLPQNPSPRLRNLPIPLPNRRQILPARPPHRLPPHRLCAILWQRG